MNVAELDSELSELVGQPFRRREFALKLVEIYNAPKATLTKLRKGGHGKTEQRRAWRC
jgi:hypothetical protein